MNLKAIICIASILLMNLAQAEPNTEPRLIGKRWADMNYGPSMNLTLQVTKDNIAYKGIAIRLDEGVGGISSGTEFMVFDTDTLRWAGAWTSDSFINWHNIALDGKHGVHSSIVGDLHLSNPVSPGWGRPKDGYLKDERQLGRDNNRYGPLARDWGHWKGHYIHGNKVVLSYTIGNARILEMPGTEGLDNQRVFTRTFNIGPRNQKLYVRLNEGKRIVSVDNGIAHMMSMHGKQDTFLALVDAPDGVTWSSTKDKRSVLMAIPPGNESLRIKVMMGRADSVEAFTKLAANSAPAADLKPYTMGGDAQWSESVSTKGQRGKNDGAYTIDTLPVPDKNPYRAWLRLSGFDFFEDDSRAAVCTWNGDVWLVEGINESLRSLKWTRIASGMFQPLGLKIVDDEIYVLCRDQITLLRDVNGDGETDFYQNFNNDHQVTAHFHEFALDLKLGEDGDFYYTKGACHAADAIVPQHGTLIRVARDGSSSDIVAKGFRAPNGLGLGPNGEKLVADNQGHWMPANRINWVEPDGFYGYMQGYHDRKEFQGFDDPLCWIHPKVDRSPGTFLWVPDGRWGPLKDKILSVSYGMGQIFHVLTEEIEGVHQGGVVRFPLEFKTGVTRANFRPTDGQLYVAGLFGWAGNKTQPGGFYRVRYTGKPLYMPESLNIAADGIMLRFTEPLDIESATDPGNYDIEQWNYDWTEEYGSPDLKLDGSPGRDKVHISQITLSSDQQTVYLSIPAIQRVMQMNIELNLKAQDGTKINHQVHHTINALGNQSVEKLAGKNVIQSLKTLEGNTSKDQGLLQSISNVHDQHDTRISRLAGLYVKSDGSPSPFMDAGTFTSHWKGFLRVDINREFQFSVEGTGSVDLKIAGKVVTLGDSISLKQGLNPIEISYRSPTMDDAALRLYWESNGLVREPIPATAFVLPEDRGELDTMQIHRHARNMITEQQCLKCHAPDTTFASPELNLLAPSFRAISENLNSHWITQYIEDDHTQFSGKLSQQDVADVVASMKAYDLRSSAVDKQTYSPLAIAAGKKLYTEFGCATCHTFSDTKDEFNRHSLREMNTKWQHGTLRNFLRDPQAYNPKAKMPNFSLSTNESLALEAYILSQSTAQVSSPPFIPGDMVRGHSLMKKMACVNCHLSASEKPSLYATPFSDLNQESINRGCLAGTKNDRGTAPSLSFTQDERLTLQAFLLEKSDSLSRVTPAEYAERQIQSLNCLGCHSRDGLGDRWALLDMGKDSRNEEEATIHIGRPHLNFSGEKLQPNYMKKLFSGTLPTKTRPRLSARMPSFPQHAPLLAEGIAAQHGYSDASEPTTPIDPPNVTLGKNLAIGEDKFRCNTCHAVGASPALAGVDTETINFTLISQRLRKSYYERFTLDPQRAMPGTQMPRFADNEGNSPLTEVLEGDIRKQYEAIWEYLLSLKNEK